MSIERYYTQPVPEEDRYLSDLRPRSLAEFVGQPAVREQLTIAIEAARGRGEPLDHVLLDGPPGLGKTTLAHVVAAEMGARLRVTSGPAIVRQGDLMSLLTQLEPGDIVFIDEVHRLNPVVEEFLYPALEDFRVDYTTESGIGGRTINFQLPRFTLIGATTRAGMLSAALRSRFGHVLHLDYYDQTDLTRILARTAQLMDAPCDAAALERLAGRARGTPRIANRLIRRARDFAQVRGDGRLAPDVVDRALEIQQIDQLGLDALDRAYLTTLMDHFDGGPAGIEAIAASMGHERDTLEDVVEPYLLQVGFVVRTPRGRAARPAAYAHLNRPAPTQRGSTADTEEDTLFE